jgi:deoxyribodipyrimidine photo-lyase
LKTDKDLFGRWRRSQMGILFVDVHIRELNQTGFMSNRGCANCASFLTRDYQIEWRWGAAWFENQLLDYDACSNWLPELTQVSCLEIHAPWILSSEEKLAYQAISYPLP